MDSFQFFDFMHDACLFLHVIAKVAIMTFSTFNAPMIFVVFCGLCFAGSFFMVVSNVLVGEDVLLYRLF